MAEKREEFGREITIRVRPVDALKLNTSPEKAGKDLVKKADLVLEFVLRTEELGLLELPETLWTDEDDCAIPDLAAPLMLRTTFVGVVKLGYKKGECEEFENARLKKISVELMPGKQVKVHAQARVDPGRKLDMLYDLVVDRQCKFGFSGAVLLKDGEDDEDADDAQQELKV